MQILLLLVYDKVYEYNYHGVQSTYLYFLCQEIYQTESVSIHEWHIWLLSDVAISGSAAQKSNEFIEASKLNAQRVNLFGIETARILKILSRAPVTQALKCVSSLQDLSLKKSSIQYSQNSSLWLGIHTMVWEETDLIVSPNLIQRSNVMSSDREREYHSENPIVDF